MGERCWAAASTAEGPKAWIEGASPEEDRCRNPARYDSGLCGVHDITHNGGRGKRGPGVDARSERAAAARAVALAAIREERLRQIRLWGPGPYPSTGAALAVLGEEFGEVCEALQGEGDLDEELTQLAAVCVRWLEERAQRRPSVIPEPPESQT